MLGYKPCDTLAAMYTMETSLLLFCLLALGCCEPTPNGLECLTCLSTGQTCEMEKTIKFQCRDQEIQCVDIQVTGNFDAATDVRLKGCREFTCSTSLLFSTQNSSVSVHCCDSSLCNDYKVLPDQNTEPNGRECYSCNTVNGEVCSGEEITKTQCYGPLTSCIEVIGTDKDGEYMTPVVTKGCATPNMCDGSLLPLLQNLKNAKVQCCNESLCNQQFTEDAL